jgi:protein gp37
MRDQDGARIYRTSGARYPLSKDKAGRYKIRSGEMISVCMTSDFFLEEADPWRPEAWDIMRQRSDVIFYLLTKRPQRVSQCLPEDWGIGWDNIFFNVTCENQERADERIPLLLELPFRHKGLNCAPLLGPIRIGPYLDSEQIEQVACGGENYGGTRCCDFAWVQALRAECASRDITFCFLETGTVFIKDGRKYTIPSKREQTRQALRSGMNYQSKKMVFNLKDSWGLPIPEKELYVPHFRQRCEECSMKMLCNGCSDCGKCSKSEVG